MNDKLEQLCSLRPAVVFSPRTTAALDSTQYSGSRDCRPSGIVRLLHLATGFSVAWLAVGDLRADPADATKSGKDRGSQIYQNVFKASTAPPSEKKEANPLSFLDGRFVFDLEARIRGEIRENNRDFDSSFDDPLDDSWLLYRFRLGLAVKPVSWLKLYAQTQDAREEFSDRPDIPGVFGAEGDDVFDLRQAYVALGDAKLFPVTLTLGRQALTYGDGRLVADAKWVNVGRTFDAARVRFEARKYSAEAFVARPVQIKRHEFNDSDAADNFAGVYVSSTLFPKQTTDLYVFYRDKDDNQPDLDPTNRVNPRGTWNGPAARFATIGARIKSQAGQLHGWDYSGELAYQTGELFASDKRSRRFDLNAVALHTALGYTADEVLWKPRFGVEYNYASGDRNPSDGNSESFQNLFPQNHDKYGFIDLFSWRNLHDLRAQLNVKPLKLLALQFDYHSFWLADTHDFGYRVNGFAPLRPRTPDGRDVRTIGARNFAGREIDFTMTYPVNKNITLQAGYSHFFAGDYLRDTGPADDADFSYIMTTVIF